MNQTLIDTSWRRITLTSFATLVFVVLAWNAAALFIDGSGLDDGGAWVSMGLLSFLGTVMFGGPAIVVCLGSGVVAMFASPWLARVCAGLSATVCLACAGGLVWLGAQMVFSPTPTDAAFGATSLVLALVLLIPAVVCVRQARAKQRFGGENSAARRSLAA